MTNRIVVMGGSFNPPTIAHLKLMQAALDSVDALPGTVYARISGLCGQEDEKAALSTGYHGRGAAVGDAGELM